MSSRHERTIDPPFSLRREDAGDVAVVVVEGEVDMVTAPAIQKELESIPPGTNVVIDLCDTPFMDSTGLRVLLAARRPLTGVSISRASPAVLSRACSRSRKGQVNF